MGQQARGLSSERTLKWRSRQECAGCATSNSCAYKPLQWRLLSAKSFQPQSQTTISAFPAGAEQRTAGKLAKPTGGVRRKGQRVARKPDAPPSLKDQGIDKSLAHRARKYAAMPEQKIYDWEFREIDPREIDVPS